MARFIETKQLINGTEDQWHDCLINADFVSAVYPCQDTNTCSVTLATDPDALIIISMTWELARCAFAAVRK